MPSVSTVLSSTILCILTLGVSGVVQYKERKRARKYAKERAAWEQEKAAMQEAKRQRELAQLKTWQPQREAWVFEVLSSIRSSGAYKTCVDPGFEVDYGESDESIKRYEGLLPNYVPTINKTNLPEELLPFVQCTSHEEFCEAFNASRDFLGDIRVYNKLRKIEAFSPYVDYCFGTFNNTRDRWEYFIYYSILTEASA